MPLRYTFFMVILLTSVLLSAGSCTAVQEEDPDIIVKIDPEFVVDLFEQRAPEDGVPSPGLWVESLESFPCSGYTVTTSILRAGSSIEVMLSGTKPPDSCDNRPAPAAGFISLGNLPNGEYFLNFMLGQAIENPGTLLVQDGRYEWLPEREAGIDVQQRVLYRIPDGILWGYVQTSDEQEEPQANQFILNLKTLTEEHDLPAGHYGYFTVAGTGLPFAHRSIEPAGNYKFFVRRFAGGLQGVRQLLDGYRNAASQPLEIRCWSTEGDL